VSNGGSAAETRGIAFATDAGVPQQASVVLPPGAAVVVRASIGASASVVATLQPSDALPQDDALQLDLRPLRRRRVAVDPACGEALASAIAAHPALTMSDPGSAASDAVVDCSGRDRAGDAPTLRVRAAQLPVAAHGAARWAASMPPARRVLLDTGRMRIAAHLEARPGDSVLLAIGDDPVIVRRQGPSSIVETSLDLGAPQLAQRAELPLVVNAMLETLLGERLLDATIVADRGADSATVVPAVRPGETLPSAAATRRHEPASSPLLLAALLVLVWELVALLRQWRRLGPGVRTKPA
jgi:hypothetical protein